ncbi:ribosylnicotinamide kinase, partial [Phlyctochytrium planicorne]
DKFYKTDTEVPLLGDIQDWDCPEALDMASFVKTLSDLKTETDLKSILGDNRTTINPQDIPLSEIESIRNQFTHLLERYQLILVDGFLLYDSLDVYSTLDVKIFLHAGFETLLRRRNERTGYITLEGR